jgi:hypothetical protein
MNFGMYEGESKSKGNFKITQYLEDRGAGALRSIDIAC